MLFVRHLETELTITQARVIFLVLQTIPGALHTALRETRGLCPRILLLRSNEHNPYTMINESNSILNIKINPSEISKVKTRNAYKILVGKPEGKRPLGRPRRRWVNNIKMDLR
jgi:hypothetical protein